VQVDSIKTRFESVPGVCNQRLKLTCDEPLSNFAFTFNLRRYTKGLTGVVPAALGGLTALTGLDLTGNQLTGMPAELGNLVELDNLYLGENELTSVPAALGGLTALTLLSLDRNQLTSVPAELGVGRCR
jgi:Leucine-rich repeat (LRR) protein